MKAVKQAAVNYGQALYQTIADRAVVDEAERVYSETPELQKILCSPIVNYTEKAAVIEQIFPQEMKSFFKSVCYHGKADCLPEIFEVYTRLTKEKMSILTATLYYTILPGESYIEQMKAFLLKKYGGKEVELKLVQDISLIGGFLLEIGNTRYDMSTRGAMERLRQKLVRR